MSYCLLSLAIVLSVHRFPASDYPFGIFKLFVNSDGKNFHHYQQEQSHMSPHIIEHKQNTRIFLDGNSGPGLGYTHILQRASWLITLNIVETYNMYLIHVLYT